MGHWRKSVAALSTVVLVATVFVGSAFPANASVAPCGIISQARVQAVVGLPHGETVRHEGECEYLAWQQSQKPTGVRGPSPTTVRIRTGTSAGQSERLSLDLGFARRQLRSASTSVAVSRYGLEHAAAFSIHKSSPGQTGLVWSSEARGIWWTARRGRIRQGIEIVVSEQRSTPAELKNVLARLSAIAVPAFRRHLSLR
jgi:hypothetical protein